MEAIGYSKSDPMITWCSGGVSHPVECVSSTCFMQLTLFSEQSFIERRHIEMVMRQLHRDQCSASLRACTGVPVRTSMYIYMNMKLVRDTGMFISKNCIRVLMLVCKCINSRISD
ncbi:unnamed protein product, partial [Dicrocoelium dendriticum]